MSIWTGQKRKNNFPLMHTCVHVCVLEMSLDRLIILWWILCCLNLGQGCWSQTQFVQSVDSLGSADLLTYGVF